MAQKTVLKIEPSMTEKSLTRAQKACYTFLVGKSLNKPEIRKLISQRFKVKVKKVNLQNRPPKRVRRLRRGGQITGFRPAFKLAFVYLEKGQKIEGFEIKETKSKEKKDEKTT